MIRCRFRLALAIVATIVLVPSVAGQGPAREALFGLESPVAGPFPSDWFTVPDHTNKTHRRVSLPLPDCEVYVSDCEDVAVINELDGFNLQPRLSVPFSGPIDANTVTSDTVFLVSLGSAAPDQHYMPWGTVIGIDQVVWDTFTNTLHVESNALLAQHTRFALIHVNVKGLTLGLVDGESAIAGAVSVSISAARPIVASAVNLRRGVRRSRVARSIVVPPLAPYGPHPVSADTERQEPGGM